MYIPKYFIQPVKGRSIQNRKLFQRENSEKTAGALATRRKIMSVDQEVGKEQVGKMPSRTVSKSVIMQIAKSQGSRKLAGSFEVKHHVLAAIQRVAMPSSTKTDKAGFGTRCSCRDVTLCIKAGNSVSFYIH